MKFKNYDPSQRKLGSFEIYNAVNSSQCILDFAVGIFV